jgi:glycosyltransferase involved in cell wall biosynthesis
MSIKTATLSHPAPTRNAFGGMIEPGAPSAASQRPSSPSIHNDAAGSNGAQSSKAPPIPKGVVEKYGKDAITLSAPALQLTSPYRSIELMPLSVIIITHNESANIGDCLRSCDFADERIVVDSGSTDTTVEQALAEGAHVVVRADWCGFGIQKNRALALAQGDWVLSLDADERVTPALRQQIVEAIATGAADGYEIATQTDFYGHRVRHSEFYANTSSIRLFRRGSGRFRDTLVHENVALDSGRVAHLSAPLQHLSFVDPDTYLRKVNQYADLQARMLYERGRRCTYFAAPLRAAAAFFKSYVIKLGVLDGSGGFMVAVFAAEMTYHKYFKLMLLTQRDA